MTSQTAAHRGDVITTFAADDGAFTVLYDGVGERPHIVIDGPDGTVELRGLDEITRTFDALTIGLELAERHALRGPCRGRA